MATVTRPPRSVIQVAIDSLSNDEEYEFPEPLVVQNPNGVTVGDFIAAVHPYLQAHKDKIIHHETNMFGYAPPEPQWYYQGQVDFPKFDPDVYISLMLAWEEADEHWAGQAETVRWRRESGFGSAFPQGAEEYLGGLDRWANPPDSDAE